MNTLSISLLGGLHLSHGDQTLPTPSPQKLISVLAYLVLHCQHPQDREQMAGQLWPEMSLAEARANLRRHLHLLRQILPGASKAASQADPINDATWIITDRETVQWNPAADFRLDVDEFTRCATRCTGPDPIQAFEACLELYQGDLLPELYEDWLIAERENLLALYLNTLKTASNYEMEHGRYLAALRYAHQWLARDPLHEEAHRQIMRLYYLAGDRPAALRQFEQCRDVLRGELDVEPMPDTVELYQQIVEQRLPSPAVQPPAASALIPAQQATIQLKTVETKQDVQAQTRRSWQLRPLAWMAMLLALGILAGIYFGLRPVAQPSALALSGPNVVQDTWITVDFPNDLYWPDDPDKTPHSSYSRTHLQRFEPQAAKDRILIRFDLSQLPENIAIEKAVFEIYLETWIEPEVPGALTESYPAQVSAFQVNTPWQADQATFNQPWTRPGLQAGVDYIAQPLDTQDINGTAWLTFDVTRAALEWVRQPASNHGLMLMISAAPANIAHYWVNMTDQPAPNLRPVLRITY